MYTFTSYRNHNNSASHLPSLDSIFDNFLHQGLSPTVRVGKKPSDGSSLTYEIDVPGVAPEDISVKVEDQKILLSLPAGKFHIKLPTGIDPKGTTANLKYGVLTVNIPKDEANSVEVTVESD